MLRKMERFADKLTSTLQDEDEIASLVSQHAEKCLRFSSQYGFYTDNTFSYKAKCVCGEPSITAYGDHSNALVTKAYGPWWRNCPSGQVFKDDYEDPNNNYKLLDFVDVAFATAVFPHRLKVHENLNPGSIVQIWTLIDGAFILLHERPYKACSRAVTSLNTAEFRFDPEKIPKKRIKMIRLMMEQTENWYFSELDSMELIGTLQPPSVNPNSDEPASAESICGNTDLKEASSPLAELPDELIVHIMECMKIKEAVQFSSTCSRFRKCFRRSKLMSKLNLKTRWNKITPPMLDSIANFFQSRLKWIDLSWCGLGLIEDDWNEKFHEFFRALKNSETPLTRLRLNNTNCYLETVNLILESFPLTELSMDDIVINGPCTQEMFSPFPTTLVALNIAGTSITTDHLLLIFHQLTELKYLSISNCLQIDLDDFLTELQAPFPGKLISLEAWRVRLSEADAVLKLKEFIHLEELDLGWSMNKQLPDLNREFAEVFSALTKLKKVFLTSARFLQDSTLITLVTSNANLEQLDVMGCSKLSFGGISRVFELCENLIHVDMGYINSLDKDGYEELKRNFPKVDICCCQFLPG